MDTNESVNLTQIMEREGILSIARVDTSYPSDGLNATGYIVHMRGNICGTGKDVGEAYQTCLAYRDRRAA